MVGPDAKTDTKWKEIIQLLFSTLHDLQKVDSQNGPVQMMGSESLILMQ